MNFADDLMRIEAEALGEKSSGAGNSRKKSVEPKASGMLQQGCFESIYHDGKPYFLVLNDGKFHLAEAVESNGKVYVPKEAKGFPYEPYGFYDGDVDVGSLFCEVKQWMQKLIDIEPIYHDILAVCVLLSYQQEKMQTVPYLFIYGDNESGKTTVLKVLNKMCYRPLFGVTIPTADLYGYLEDEDAIGCILEDEIQGVEKDTDKIKIYKSGYARGAKVPRIITTENSRYIKYYNAFCFKACASEQIPRLKGFSERFIFIPMVSGSPEVEWVDLTREQMEQLSILRNKLLKWRMLTRSLELPGISINIRGRLKEIWKPLLQVACGLPVYETLLGFVEDFEKERINERQGSLEGKVVKVVVDAIGENTKRESGKVTVPFSRIWSGLQEELDGEVNPAKEYMMHTSEFDDVTKRKVAFRLRELLGAKATVTKEKRTNGSWASVKSFTFKIDKVARVAKKYGFNFATVPLIGLNPRGESASEAIFGKPEKSIFQEKKPEKSSGKIDENADVPQGLNSMGRTVEKPTTPAETCARWRTESCPAAVPSAIFPETPCPLTCSQYAPKSKGSAENERFGD